MRRLVLTGLFVLLVSSGTASASFPGTNGKIAFDRSPDGVSSKCIYTMKPDGTGEAPLIPCGTSRGLVRWFPDGSRLAFMGPGGIGIVNSDGTNLRDGVVYEGSSQSYALSPDGTQVAVSFVSCGGDPQVCRAFIEHADIEQQQFQTIADSNFVFSGLDWSPDGDRIAFHRDTGVYSVRIDGSDMRLLAQAPAGAHEPSWSPSGDKIAFSSTADAEGDREIYVMNADGTNQIRLTSNVISDRSPRWSPDGTRIVFVSDRTGRDEIWVMNPDGTSQTRLTTNTGYEAFPDWQPIPVNSYPRPKGATPTQVSLVPAYTQCAAPNRTHGPPLAFPSCSSPAQASDELTVGTADSNGKPTKSRGLVRYDTFPGAPATPADEADVRITVELSDVYHLGTLADYTGELRSRTSLRITDKLNTPHPGGPGAATVSDATLGGTVPCAPTADTTEGASCNLVTTFDALVPGTVTETRRSIWALGAAQLDDGGADNDADTPGDNTLFMTQGIFIP